MAVVDQPYTTYGDTDPQRESVADLISIIDPSEAPAVKYFGLDNDPGKFMIENWPATKVEWLEDELAALTGSLATSCASGDTAIPLTDGSKWHVGDIVQIDSEYIWISAVSTATNSATVTRNHGGTQASHAKSATVTLIGTARLEGADADYDRATTDMSRPYNYTQILQDDLQVTRTARRVSHYGLSDMWDYQLSKKLPEQMRLMDKLFYRGQRKSGSTSAPRAFGGLETYVTNNTTSLGAALTQSDLEDIIQDCWTDGGMPDTILCNAWVKRKISGFYSDSVRTTRDENRGGVVISEVETEFGVLSVVMDRWCPSSKLYVAKADDIGFLPLDPFATEELAKTGDSIKGQLIGEYTLVVRSGKGMGYIAGISTTS